MTYHKNNCKHIFIIYVMGKIYEDNFDQNGPSYRNALNRKNNKYNNHTDNKHTENKSYRKNNESNKINVGSVIRLLESFQTTSMVIIAPSLFLTAKRRRQSNPLGYFRSSVSELGLFLRLKIFLIWISCIFTRVEHRSYFCQYLCTCTTKCSKLAQAITLSRRRQKSNQPLVNECWALINL